MLLFVIIPSETEGSGVRPSQRNALKIVFTTEALRHGVFLRFLLGGGFELTR